MIYYKEAKDTLSAIEMDIGETLVFKLRNGQERTMKLLETSASIVETNLEDIKVENPSGGTILRFNCKVNFDGHQMTMERYIGTQESFYVPYVINGMRLWFDGVSDIFNLANETHGSCKPKKKARFAFNDVLDPICPEEMKDWCPNDENFISIGDSYNGEDCWMGLYFGSSCHGGLDINHPQGTPLWVPFDIDYQYLFNSLEAGDNNNRWRGIKRWADGSLWTIQVHHLIKMLVPQHTPLEAGTHFAEAAGVRVGSHEHSHFVFKITEGMNEILLDPWILFWEIFENKKKRKGDIRAVIEPLHPGKTGRPVFFSSAGSKHGKSGTKIKYHWTFGDGGYSAKENPIYTYAKPGIYPVTLLVDDGTQKASVTQHVTIDGRNITAPSFVLMSKDETSFRARPLEMLDTYGLEPDYLPHTIYFTARQSRPVPDAKEVKILNLGSRALCNASLKVYFSCKNQCNWLDTELILDDGVQIIRVAVNGTGLKQGIYIAHVMVDVPGAMNSPQVFNVVMEIPVYPPRTNVIVGSKDKGFYNTQYFWVGHHYCNWSGGKRGYRGFYLTNGRRPKDGEFVRFTPDLKEGKYEIYLSEDSPFSSPSLIPLRVHSADGDDYLYVDPSKSLFVGEYRFNEGCDGFVEIHAKDSKGQIIADALIFRCII